MLSSVQEVVSLFEKDYELQLFSRPRAELDVVDSTTTSTEPETSSLPGNRASGSTIVLDVEAFPQTSPT